MRVFVLRKQDTGLEGLAEEIGQATTEDVKRQAAEKLNEALNEIKTQFNALEITPDNFDKAAQTIEEVINGLSNLLGSIRAVQERVGQQPLRKQRGTVSFFSDTDVELAKEFELIVKKIVKIANKIIKAYPPIDKETADEAKRAIDEMRKLIEETPTIERIKEILNQMEENIVVVEMPPE